MRAHTSFAVFGVLVVVGVVVGACGSTAPAPGFQTTADGGADDATTLVNFDAQLGIDSAAPADSPFDPDAFFATDPPRSVVRPGRRPKRDARPGGNPAVSGRQEPRRLSLPHRGDDRRVLARPPREPRSRCLPRRDDDVLARARVLRPGLGPLCRLRAPGSGRDEGGGRVQMLLRGEVGNREPLSLLRRHGCGGRIGRRDVVLRGFDRCRPMSLRRRNSDSTLVHRYAHRRLCRALHALLRAQGGELVEPASERLLRREGLRRG